MVSASVEKLKKHGFLNKKIERDLVNEYVQKLRIKLPGIDRAVKYLSGGNQQKVVFAKWLCAGSDVYIFDEPTRGIDVGGAKTEVYKLINTLAEQGGNAIIVISSELPEVLGVCDRIAVFHEGGTIAVTLGREEATQEKIMYYAMGGEIVMKLLDNKSKVIKVYKELSRAQGVSALLPLAIVVIFFTIMSDNFLNSYNVMNILRQASVYAIMATGMTFVILTGGIDLGQGGSVLALAAVVCAKVINATGNMWLGILSAVAVGVVIGGINGVMIAYVRLPAFIMTLGSLYMVRGGITLYITNSTQVNVKGAELFSFIGQGFLLGIPFPVYLFIGIGILAVIFLCYTSTGRHIFAVGSNVVSARLSGVKVEKTLVVAYILSSVCVALAGVVYLARLTAAQPTAGEGYELESIAAAVVGAQVLPVEKVVCLVP